MDIMQYVKLGQLVDLKQGLAINAKSNHLISAVETSISLLRIADMPTKRKVIYMKEETPKRYIANQNDIIYTRTGQVGLVFTGQYGVVHNNCFRVFSKDENICQNKFLYWCLRLKSVYDQANSFAVGSAQPDLTHTSFKKIKVPLFKIDNQNKIETLLCKYDILIENNNKRIKLLEAMAEELYKEWFVRFRFPGYEKTKFINGIPENWEYKKFSDVCNYIRGISYSSEEIEVEEAKNILINLKNIKDYGGFRKENFKIYDGDYKEEQIVKKFDLVMALTEMVQERRIIGYVGLIPSYDGNCVISADLIKIISDTDNIFLYSMFIYGGYSLCFSQYGNGTNVIHLRPTSLRNIKLLIPTKEIIDKYVSVVKNYYEMIDKLQLDNEILIKQRDYLLPRLMSGRLSVENKNIV